MSAKKCKFSFYQSRMLRSEMHEYAKIFSDFFTESTSKEKYFPRTASLTQPEVVSSTEFGLSFMWIAF